MRDPPHEQMEEERVELSVASFFSPENKQYSIDTDDEEEREITLP
jgi:hypothetical protein